MILTTDGSFTALGIILIVPCVPIKYHLPQQHLRNLARKGSWTKYVFLTDIDILPSHGLAKQLTSFLKDNLCNKCAYVITPYELDSNFNYPLTICLGITNKLKCFS